MPDLPDQVHGYLTSILAAPVLFCVPLLLNPWMRWFVAMFGVEGRSGEKEIAEGKMMNIVKTYIGSSRSMGCKIVFQPRHCVLLDNCWDLSEYLPK
jgi:hypothetical protein